MRKRLVPKLNYANVVGTLALFLALAGGTAFAATGALDSAAKKPHHRKRVVRLRANSVNSRSVKDNTLTSADLKDGKAVEGADIADGSLTGADLVPASIGPAQLADGSVGSREIADGSISGADLASESVGTDTLAPDSVDSDAVADGVLGREQFYPLSIKAADIDVLSLKRVGRAEYLGGFPVEHFVPGSIYRVSTETSVGTAGPEGTHKQVANCKEGDLLLGGGPIELNAQTHVIESRRSTNSWLVVVKNSAAGDAFQVSIWCADR
jgi:hypothetical protein